jgi:hypothetical protein
VNAHDPLFVRVRELSQQHEVDRLIHWRRFLLGRLLRRTARVAAHVVILAACNFALLQWWWPPLRLVGL